MIHYILIKIYRWAIFLVFATGLLYAGMANAADFDQIELPFRGLVHSALGLAIVWHFALLLFCGSEIGNVLFRLYLDNHYTVVELGRHPQTYDSVTWRERQHEYDDMADIKIYYNNPEGLPSITKRLR